MKQRRSFLILGGWLVSLFIAFLVGRTTASRDGGETVSIPTTGAGRADVDQRPATKAGGAPTSTSPNPGIAFAKAKEGLDRLENGGSPRAPDKPMQGGSTDDEPIPFAQDTDVNSLSENITEKLRKFLGDRGEVLSVDCAEYPCIAFLSTKEKATDKGLGNQFMGEMVQALADVGFSRSMIELSRRGDGTLAISVETDESKPLDGEDVRKRVNRRVSDYFEAFGQ